MLYVVAVNARGASGALMVWRDEGEGCLLRAGEHATCDLRLPGAGIATCDVWFEAQSWRSRRPDGNVAGVRDGDSIVVGQWVLVFLVGRVTGLETSTRRDDRGWTDPLIVPPGVRRSVWFEVDGRWLAELHDDLPVMLGGGECCAVRIPWTREVVSAVLRRDGRRTRCYPISGTTLSRNGASVAGPAVLADGDVLALDDAPAVRFVNPDEAIDRLLGVLLDDAPNDLADEPPCDVPARARAARIVGTGPDAFLSVWEAAFAVGTAVAVLAQCAVTVVQW